MDRSGKGSGEVSTIAEYVHNTYVTALTSRERWIEACVKSYGDPDINALEQIKRKDFVLSSYPSYGFDRTAYQAVLWHKGNAVAIYVDKMGIRGFWCAAYDEIPEVLPDGFNVHLLNWELMYGPTPCAEMERDDEG